MTETPSQAYQPAHPMSPSDQRLWATLIHIGGIFFGVLPSLIGYLVTKDRGAYIRDHTRVALNFHLTVLIAGVVCGILAIFIIGIFLLAGLDILVIVYSIVAAIAAGNGQYYRYPLSIEFIR